LKLLKLFELAEIVEIIENKIFQLFQLFQEFQIDLKSEIPTAAPSFLLFFCLIYIKKNDGKYNTINNTKNSRN